MNGFRRLLIQMLDEIEQTAIKARAACDKVTATTIEPFSCTSANAYALRFQQVEVAAKLVLGTARLTPSPLNDITLEYCWRTIEFAWREAISGKEIDSAALVAVKFEVLHLIHAH